MKIVIAILILFVYFSTSFAESNKDLQTYRDKEHGFILQYPTTWSQVPSTHERTRIKIVSENGNGAQDCMVNVQIEHNSKNLTARDFVRSAPTMQEHEQILRNTMPDAKVIKRGETHISNQDAIYYIVDFTFKSVGIEVPMRSLMVQTKKNEYLYSVGCRAEKHEFEKYMTDFQLIFVGFLIWPNTTSVGDKSEVVNLCKKYNGVPVLKSSQYKAALSCDLIRREFERQLGEIASNGTLFSSILEGIKSVRHKSINELKNGNFPDNQKCEFIRGSGNILVCESLETEPRMTSKFIATQAGIVTKAIITMDLDWYRKQVSQQVKDAYGVPPSDAYINYYMDSILAANSIVGGVDEKYERTKDHISCTMTFR